MKKLLKGILPGIAILFLANTIGCKNGGGSSGPGKATYIDSVTNIPLLLDEAKGVASAVVDGTTYLFVGSKAENGVNVFSLNENDGSQTLVDSIADGGDLQLALVNDLETAVIGGTTYLFVAGYSDDGISVFSVAGDGRLTNVFNVTDDNTMLIRGIWDLEIAVIETNTYLFATGRFDDGVTIFSISNAGELAVTDTQADNANRSLDAAWGLATAVIGANTYLYVSSSSYTANDGVTIFKVDDQGMATWVHTLTDTPALLLGARGLATATIGTTTYLFITSGGEDGVTIYPIKTGADEGKVLATENINVPNTAARKLDGPMAVTTATLGTTTYLYVMSQDDNSITVFSVDAAGAVTDVQTVVDDRDTRFQTPESLRFVMLGATPYLFVTGVTSDGFSAFSVDTTTGMLTHASSTHDRNRPQLLFDNPIGLASIEVSDKSYLLAAGATSQGFNIFQANSSAPYLSLADSIITGGSYNLNVADNTLSMATTTVGDNSYVIAGGKGSNGFTVLGIDADGKLTYKVELDNAGDLNLAGISDIITVKEESTATAKTYIVAAGATANGISSILLNADGTIVPVPTGDKGNVDDTGDTYLIGVTALATATMGTPKISYVFAAGKTDNGVSTFSMDDKGGLTNVTTGNVADTATTYLGGVDALATAVMGSKAYLFAAGETDKGISVFEFDAAAGTLTNVANTAEADDAAKYTLDVVSSIAAVTHSGVTYVMAAAGAPDNGVTVWELKEEEGKMVLTYHASFLDADKTEYKLEGSHDVLPAVVSGSLYFYVAGLNEDAINVFAFK